MSKQPNLSWRTRLKVLAMLLLTAIGAHGAVDPGELLLGELNCAACHDASAQVKRRLSSPPSPVLGANGLRLSPQWIKAFLLNPTAEHPGTGMPDLLHGLSPTDKAQAAEDLTQFLMSLHAADTNAPTIFQLGADNEGRRLFHQVGCVACHAPQEPPQVDRVVPQSEVRALKNSSVPLGNLAGKYTVRELASFLQDPLHFHPGGRMPSSRLSEAEAKQIAVYLLREQVPASKEATRNGVFFEAYEQTFKDLPDFSTLKADSTGYADKITAKSGPQKNGVALRFHGALAVPTSGDYTFWTESDDGSQLFIDDQRVVDNNAVHPVKEKEGHLRLAAGKHSIVVTYFDYLGGRSLKVSWAGPGLEREEIPAGSLTRPRDGQPMRPLGNGSFDVDSARITHGRELFAQFDCAACHQIDQPGTQSKPMDQLADAANKGCLSSTPPTNAPQYSFTETQRQQLAQAVQNKAIFTQLLTHAQQVENILTRYNCYACHERDGRGGPQGLRREYFVSTSNADLGDEGVIPPRLTGVGNKLNVPWLSKVLWNGASVRDYMATRMPQFGQESILRLTISLPVVDALSHPEPAPQPDAILFKHGQKLVGVDGLSCISCHALDGKPSLGVPALDLATVAERLQPAWFRRYLLDPQALRPGTRMPPFWPDGEAVNRDVLGGNTEKQINALWTYLTRQRESMEPAGLIRAKLELVPVGVPIVYRNFIEGAGPRSIGVGYPEKVNLAFDAENIRLALIWQNAFLDAARHRTGRGQGAEPPLGQNVQKLVAGVPFAVLDQPNTPWPILTGHAQGYQFRGYVYDQGRRPTFVYEFGDVTVKDTFLPIKTPDEGDPGFRRTLTLQAKKPVANLYFRAHLGLIEDKGNGVIMVDRQIRLTFPGSKPMLRKTGDTQELLIPVIFNGRTATVVEEFAW